MVPELKPATRKSFDAMVAATQELIGEGEVVRFAWPVKKGIGAQRWVMALWVTQPLLIFQSFRVVAVTDSAIHVFRAGWFTRTKPREELLTLPADGLQFGSGGRLVLGEDKVLVEPRWRPVAVAADVDMRGG